MNELKALKGFLIFFMIIIIGFMLLYIFDTFIYEKLFTGIVRSGINDTLYWLMSVSVSFGFPIAIFGRAFMESIKVN